MLKRNTLDRWQQELTEWGLECFGEEISMNKMERSFRLVEESLEAGQAGGMTKEQALALVDQVFDKPVGEVKQELGGVFVTLCVMASAFGIDLRAVANEETDRIWARIDLIREKQKRKAVRTENGQVVIGKDTTQSYEASQRHPGLREALPRSSQANSRGGESSSETSDIDGTYQDGFGR